MDFTLDPFQQAAIDYIEREHSVLVSAPTGAGKTLIAEAAIERAMERNERVIYTAPVKALSNQKYRDFRKVFGEDCVGILTGDVSLNPDANIVIMTTEIYRNCLFDHSARIDNVGWVIFDEIHYLDDPERGTVWEEALLFTPPEIRILSLSATAPNIQQLADWIQEIHERPIGVVIDDHRPVPLHYTFQCQGRFFDNVKMLRQHGYHNREDWHLSQREKRRGVRLPQSRRNRLDHLLDQLMARDRLPAIYFVFGRRRSETLAWEANAFDFLNEKERAEIKKMYADLLKKYNIEEERSAQDMQPLIEQGIAYHHAGMLPSLKETIEQLFTSRLIKLIFTTETFALGINMPARSVVFDELDKYYGSGFRYLTTRDFFQMAGRAGRRGMDKEGHVYLRVHPQHIPLPEVQRIIYGKPESIRSQLNTTYATLLNLYKSLGPQLLELYPRTFHAYQSSHSKKMNGRKILENKLRLLQEMGYIRKEAEGSDGKGLTDKGEFAATLFGYELPLSELHEEGVLDRLDETELSVLISGLIYEPRKGDHLKHLSPSQEKLRKLSVHCARDIHRFEAKHHIRPLTKPPHFHLAKVVEAWVSGRPFDQLDRLCNTDEGELVRHFRMIMQLLKELLHAAHSSEVMQARARQAIHLINRDVVDAEKQLQV